MPAMQSHSVKAIFVADLHLTLNPPIARSGEKDWLGVQAGWLRQIRELSEKLKAPVICAGDVFHVWNSPSELVNFAMEHLPTGMWAIPGNHDLPLHSYDDMHKSSFYTLVMASKIQLLKNRSVSAIPGYGVVAYPWDAKLRPVEPLNGKKIVAVCHTYCWSKGTGFPGAPLKQNYKALARKLGGFDYAVFGDNHTPFEAEYKGLQIFNCGGAQRRNMDEKDHRPSVGLLTKQGITRHYLDCSADKFLSVEQVSKSEKDGVTLAVSNFLEELAQLGDSDVDFNRAIDQYCLKHNIPLDVRMAIIDSIQS